MVGQVTSTTGMIINHPSHLKFPINEFFSSVIIFYLSSDTFDENTPPLSDPNYISSLGAATFRGMQSGDNDAIWLMQVCSLCVSILLIIGFVVKPVIRDMNIDHGCLGCCTLLFYFWNYFQMRDSLVQLRENSSSIFTFLDIWICKDL
jgi:hypothetical protein